MSKCLINKSVTSKHFNEVTRHSDDRARVLTGPRQSHFKFTTKGKLKSIKNIKPLSKSSPYHSSNG